MPIKVTTATQRIPVVIVRENICSEYKIVKNKQTIAKLFIIIILSTEIPNQSYNWDTGNPCGEKHCCEYI